MADIAPPIALNLAAPRRQAGSLQGWVLVSTAWLAVIATSLIAPILPRMSEHFAATPGATAMIQLSVALPALFVGLLSAPIGFLADRIGRRSVLVVALILYALFGLAPMFLDSLPAILLTRCGVGAAEAAVMTAGTALLGDYFRGGSREKWYAIQTGSASLVAVVVLAIGGALGEISWRAPFIVYALPLILAPVVMFLIWEPARGEAQAEEWGEGEALNWGKLLFICAVTLFAAMSLYVVVIQLGFILTERGFTSPALIGFGAAAAATAGPLGAVLFRIMSRASVSAKLLTAFSIAAAGFMIIAFTNSYALTIVGAAVNGLGCGMLLPTVLTWAVGGLRPQERGRGSGAWNTAFFLGQFFSPLSVLALAGALGGVTSMLMVYGVACGFAALAAAFVIARRP